MRILFIAEQIDYEPIGIMHLSSALKKAGCHSVSMGIEAGNEHIHNSLLKRLGPQEPSASGQAERARTDRAGVALLHVKA